MNLYIMRHGPAEDRAHSGLDFDRALTASGRDCVRDVARLLHGEGELPLRIFSSPLARALQTAEIVSAYAESQGGGRGSCPVHVRKELASGSDPRILVRELVTGGEDRAMLVGHEPDLSTLVARLVSSWPGPSGFQKGMVVGLHASQSGADSLELYFVADPKELRFEFDRRPAPSKQ